MHTIVGKPPFSDGAVNRPVPPRLHGLLPEAMLPDQLRFNNATFTVGRGGLGEVADVDGRELYRAIGIPLVPAQANVPAKAKRPFLGSPRDSFLSAIRGCCSVLARLSTCAYLPTTTAWRDRLEANR